MANKQKKNAQVYLRQCLADLDMVLADKDERQTAVARANLGFAYFEVRKFQEGMAQFDEAVALAERLEDLMLQVRCLGIKTLAFQAIGRLPDAYETAVSIQHLADTHNHDGIRCDALASQGQILLDSGEPLIALERIQEALTLAEGLDDPRRLMNTLGAMGQYCIAMNSPEKAEVYFARALTLAQEIGDRAAEFGFLGNMGVVLTWQGYNERAVEAFLQVLNFVQGTGDEDAELEATSQIVSVYQKLSKPEQVLTYAPRGIELAAASKKDEMLFDFYQVSILACYQLNRIEEAEKVTEQAVTAAHAGKKKDKEVDFLLSLGESAMAFGMPEKALAAYKQAREGAIRLSRHYDEAYLTGRMGVALAELGRTDEAILFHKEAVELAQRREISQLEGEQLSMLALAFLDKEERAAARDYCQSAILVFTAAELEDDAAQARKLLAEIG
ncbi:MAG: tetratricopeptide repeat protein [Chloroflexota bacterium]